MIETMLAGDANANSLNHYISDMLDDLGVDDDIILLVKIFLSRNDQLYWEYRNKKITTYEQLKIFII